MINSVPYLAALLFSTFCIPLSAEADTHVPAAIARALLDPRRPPEQVKLDAARKPAQLLAFAQMKHGARVADFMPGNAYFTRLMSDVVGTRGHVYAFLPTEQLANCAPEETAGTKALEHDPAYHDLHDAFMGPADVAALNKNRGGRVRARCKEQCAAQSPG